MTRSEFKSCWNSVSTKDMGWWWWPLALAMRLWLCATCAVGFHDYENFRTKGRRCVWCDHPWHQ